MGGQARPSPMYISRQQKVPNLMSRGSSILKRNSKKIKVAETALKKSVFFAKVKLGLLWHNSWRFWTISVRSFADCSLGVTFDEIDALGVTYVTVVTSGRYDLVR